MSPWGWEVVRKKPKPIPPDPGPPYRRIAPHIRGRVFSTKRRTSYGDMMWGMEVVNTNTGKVLVTDNCADLDRLLRECHETVAAARGAWMFEFRQKDLK
jgi:hypothetical protein